MSKKVVLVVVVLMSIMIKSYAQKIETFKEINEIHQKFKKSFDSLDYELFAEIHSERLIRIPGGKKIIDYKSYIEKQKERFENAKAENSTRTIYLRFVERINNDSVASERGIYKYIKNENLPNEKISYGNFHVIMVKENGSWKILMDYDSSEGKKVDEKDFIQAIDMNDFAKFMN